ncbi:hypothetical protein TrRE_jg5271 [Triparma retinervis]|uniref:Uncharacterized protein n=1 Tax=Triparma retinervis TaxID=2557542 RepID=A0A9W6ZX48_9STRA|nr:hypothetical protein TrRE_jg5271 [Triparma retinervis]
MDNKENTDVQNVFSNTQQSFRLKPWPSSSSKDKPTRADAPQNVSSNTQQPFRLKPWPSSSSKDTLTRAKAPPPDREAATILIQRNFRGHQGRTLAESASEARRCLHYALSGSPVFAGVKLSHQIISSFRGSVDQAERLISNLHKPFTGTLSDAVKHAASVYLHLHPVHGLHPSINYYQDLAKFLCVGMYEDPPNAVNDVEEELMMKEADLLCMYQRKKTETEAAIRIQQALRGWWLRTQEKITNADRKFTEYLLSAERGIPVYLSDTDADRMLPAAVPDFHGTEEQYHVFTDSFMRPFEGTLADLVHNFIDVYNKKNGIDDGQATSEEMVAHACGVFAFMLQLSGLTEDYLANS